MAGRIALERFGSPHPDGEHTPEDGMETIAAAPGIEEPAGSPEPRIDPQAEQSAYLARIADAVEIVASEQAALRAQCIGDTTSALGAAAESLLPCLARAGFAALIAETAKTIARRGQWPGLILSVSPDCAEAVSEALDANGQETEINVTAEPSLDPGEAQIGWSQGGAEIDIEAISEAALDRFRLQLDGCMQRGA